ncbi:carboxypeptidase-like regulatory domain-containing protein [Dinghuibacter silviterrae]|nr:carboxypeptidase-like regulatory domain-containing protein [Dinghuibacter silviterrae]
MKRLLKICLLGVIGILPASRTFAQFENFKDSVVQLVGVVMSSDSLKALPGATIMVKGERRGAVANEQGVFSIVVLKGDVLQFTFVGYTPVEKKVPTDIVGNQYSLVALMSADTSKYMTTVVLRPRPTREQFERDFVTMEFKDDAMATATKNMDPKQRARLLRTLPRDAREMTNYQLTQQARSMYYTGQAPPQNIFNPFAWSEFIKAWKRGDFKNNSDDNY